MWPFKKKRGMVIRPGESLDIEFLTSWRKNNVVIITKNGPIVLDENSQLFIEVIAENVDPIKVEIVPDFKKRVLNFVEILDPNTPKKFTGPNSPRLAFGSVMKEKKMSFGDYLKEWDDNIEKFEKIVKRSRWIRNIFIPLNIFLTFFNLYLFVTKTDVARYIDLAVGIFTIYMVYYIWNMDKKSHNDFRRYKEMRDNAFGVVKNK